LPRITVIYALLFIFLSVSGYSTRSLKSHCSITIHHRSSIPSVIYHDFVNEQPDNPLMPFLRSQMKRSLPLLIGCRDVSAVVCKQADNTIMPFKQRQKLAGEEPLYVYCGSSFTTVNVIYPNPPPEILSAKHRTFMELTQKNWAGSQNNRIVRHHHSLPSKKGQDFELAKERTLIQESLGTVALSIDQPPFTSPNGGRHGLKFRRMTSSEYLNQRSQ
ncbi:hypothetical protein BZA77DRAFT_375292, partial [Pyronema omphalodes]